jgi:molybdopterin/thiamine biosynthesis adenylyltransferase
MGERRNPRLAVHCIGDCVEREAIHPEEWMSESSVSSRATVDGESEPAPERAVFSYDDAFCRNIGWVTAEEQARLRGKRVAIAGMGGVGGVHLLTLARLGIAKFHIADFDTFDVVNTNRQVGAMMSTHGRAKVDVLAAMARDINPEIEIRSFPAGVTAENAREFLDGVDLYVDGLDFFALEAREVLFAMLAELGIPGTTVAPLGMGAALLNFVPGGMTFERYFGFAGLARARLQSSYLVDPSTIDPVGKRGPSTMMGVQLCAGIAATEALKILLGRGNVVAAPRGIHFDAYRNQIKRTWRPGGARNPLTRAAIAIARAVFLGPARERALEANAAAPA